MAPTPIIEKSSAPEVLDQAALRDSLGSNVALFREVRDLFLETTPPLLDTLARALRARNATNLQRSAHTLRGALAVVHARESAALAARLEDEARACRFADARQTFQDLQAAMQRLTRELNAL